MIDLSSDDVWPSTREKAGEWASQSYVNDGLLTLFDAACMMSFEGYGGIFDICSKYTQADINGYFEGLKNEIHKQGGVLEGYPPVKRYVNREEQDVFPVAAFLAYCNRTGTGDNRYFSRRVDELGGKGAGGGIQRARPMPCPAWFDDLRKADEALEADKCNDEADERQGAQPLAEDQVSDISCEEIVPGVTVDAIRAMLNKDSPAYCPRLLAAVMTKIAIMPREEKDAQGFTELPAAKESAYKNAVEKESIEHLRSVGVFSCTDGSKNPDPAKGDIASVCRILWRTLDGNNGRPKNQ